MSIESVMLSNISSFVSPFSFCPQSFPLSVFSTEPDGQNTGASALVTVAVYVIAFLPRSKCLLSSWLQALSAVRPVKINLKNKKNVYGWLDTPGDWS